MKAGIIGGAGHVGLPLGLVLVDHGDEVVLIDKNTEQLEEIEAGNLPYREPGGAPILESALKSGRITTATELSAVSQCDALIIVVGTPIDEHHNPQMENLLQIVENVTEHLHDGQLVVFRSTVYPGTTAVVRDVIEDAGYSVGEDVFLSFAPERVAQHKAIEEIVHLPQLVGVFDEESYERTVDLFDFVESNHPRLTPIEAELGKLFTNMWRYLTFAAANEFYLITESFADHHDVNVHRILDRTGADYPRFDVPSPGANVGGPCLTKDGWFLTDNIPYNELVSASYQVNEGMPAQIIDRMAREAPNPEKVSILGMTFKPNSDDTRNSVAFKMANQLTIKGYRDIVKVEPNLESFDDLSAIRGSDWVILMTPHDEFQDYERIISVVDNDRCLFCDIWGAWDETRYTSDNGYFRPVDTSVSLDG